VVLSMLPSLVKSQYRSTIVPIDISWNWAVNGALPEVVSALKAAVGGVQPGHADPLASSMPTVSGSSTCRSPVPADAVPITAKRATSTMMNVSNRECIIKNQIYRIKLISFIFFES